MRENFAWAEDEAAYSYLLFGDPYSRGDPGGGPAGDEGPVKGLLRAGQL